MNQLNSITTYKYRHSFKILIFFISVLYGYLMNLGIYGFGKDFYANYSNPNMFVGGYEDRVGWIIATATIGNFHIGVFLTSFLLAYSSLKMIIHFTEITIKKRLHVLVFFLLAILILHSWPIIMSSSNAMRQGIMMSFLYLALISLNRKENIKAIIYISIMLLSHKSAPIFLSMILSAFVFHRFISKQLNTVFYSLSVILIFTILLSMLPKAPGVVIGTDFSIAFLIIGLITLFFLQPRNKNTRSIISAYVYFFLLFSPIIYLGVANYQFERIWMVNIILVMLVIASRVKKDQVTALAVFQFFLLMGFTFYTGMFSSALT